MSGVGSGVNLVKFKCLVAVVLSCASVLAVLPIVWDVFSPVGYVAAAALVVAAQLGIASWQVRLLCGNASSVSQLKKSVANVYEMGVVVNAAYAIRERFPGLEIPTSTWSMTFPNLLVLLDVLETHKPSTIVEFGSGISTLCIASWLREQGQGQLVSVDHDPDWAAVTRRHLQRLGCEGFAEVVVAPLKNQEILGRSVEWYDLESYLGTAAGGVELVVVDGPPNMPGGTGLARLPALSVLAGCLADDAVVLLDDAAREGERQILRIWQEQFPTLNVRTVGDGTGLAIIETSAMSATS